MKCIAFKPLERGAMLGFADLQMDSGLVIMDCILFESGARRWCNPPGRPALTTDKKPMLDDAGKLIYSVVIDFATKEVRSKWSAAAVAAIAAFADSTTPAEAGAGNGRDSRGGEPKGSS
jgi:hypothetical protein